MIAKYEFCVMRSLAMSYNYVLISNNNKRNDEISDFIIIYVKFLKYIYDIISVLFSAN